MSEALLANAVRQHQSGNLAEAARLYSSVLKTSPRNFQALYLLGFVQFQQGRLEEADRLIGEAVKINPHSPDAFYNRGCVLQQLQRHGDALAAFDRAVVLKPDYSDAWINRGAALLALKRQAEAIASFDRALALNPQDAEALSNRATALFELKCYKDAAATFARLMAVAPEFPYTTGNLALARAYACEWRDRAGDLARVTSELRSGKRTISPHASVLLLEDAEDQLRCARVWVADRCPPAPSPLWRGERYGHDKIRLAYVSADFHAHATAFLIAGVFEHHDRSRFEIAAVSFSPEDKSGMRERLMRGCDRYIEVAGRSDADIAAMLRQMKIDIAIDLKGFTQDSRPGIFAARPSPIQINYLAHPGTMGADYMDYIVADETVIPRDHEGFYSEKVVYLPDTYQANDSRRRIAECNPTRSEMGLPEDAFVFCSFKNSYKITPAIFDIWMRLLKEVEGSVLWLFEDNPDASANLKDEARARGINPARLIFAARVDAAAHLARQRLADLFLDTLPCTAHTTASDALWVGLPVLTILGSTFAGRVAASLLRAIGMPELIGPSLQAYEELALHLARDKQALADIRAKLAGNRSTHPLFDTARFTRHLETAYTMAWERYQRGERPAGFAVAGRG
jgi:predicted O-linked N-acetylglucosamine transferase (SPINDLY family)